jgi:hypothetical protein
MATHKIAARRGELDDPVAASPDAAAAGDDNVSRKEALELSKLLAERNKAALETEQLAGVALSRKELRARKKRLLAREIAELSKTSTDRDKAELELAQLRAAALSSQELQVQRNEDAERRSLELQKLRRDTKNGRWSPWFEFGKVVVPAGAIAASIYLGALNISSQQERDQLAGRNQRDRDRSVETSQQLVHFQNQMTATIEQPDKSKKPDIAKQRNAIAVVRSLRKDAIPSLLANLELDQDPQVWQALDVALLELNDDPETRLVVRSQLINSIKSALTIETPDISALDRYVILWQACLDQYRKANREFYLDSVSRGNELAEELKARSESRFKDDPILPRLKQTIERIKGT